MIECVFTIDYEIYGNGEGSLNDLVFEPTERLKAIFAMDGIRFVVFVEASELEVIDLYETDDSIGRVKQQVRALYLDGFEIGLHLHPQWYNANRENGAWVLDYDEYNICKLPRERVVAIIDRSIEYLRRVVGDGDFMPLSFRAGNWLFQPSATVAEVIAAKGIKIDSSVFKGGLQRQHELDYRRTISNGYFWRFSTHVDRPDVGGRLLEIPTFTRMVPFWKMLTAKRVGMSKRGPSVALSSGTRLNQVLDRLRLFYPLKLDFCRMTLTELTSVIDAVTSEDAKDPGRYRPIVAIGHTKDLVDFETVRMFLSYLRAKSIPVVTFNEVYSKCRC